MLLMKRVIHVYTTKKQGKKFGVMSDIYGVYVIIKNQRRKDGLLSQIVYEKINIYE